MLVQCGAAVALSSVIQLSYLFKDGVGCIMEEPDRSDALSGSQVLQVHEERDSIKA